MLTKTSTAMVRRLGLYRLSPSYLGRRVAKRVRQLFCHHVWAPRRHHPGRRCIDCGALD